MFKAKLISEHNKYQALKRKLWFFLLISAPLAILFVYVDFPLWLEGIFVVVVLSLFSWMLTTEKSMLNLLNNATIQINEDCIRLISNKKENIETIDLDKVESINVKKDYTLPQETISDIVGEIKGNPIQNFIIIRQSNKDRKLVFEIDSYYMINQLKKLIEIWSKKGYKIIAS